MKNSFGSSITVTLFGESHGVAIGAVVDGLAPGIKIDSEYISASFGILMLVRLEQTRNA